MIAAYCSGKLHTSPIGIAEHLNQHFTNIGRYLAKTFHNRSPTLSKDAIRAYNFKLNPVSEMFDHKELIKMKTSKAIGLDKISARILRGTACFIAPSLTYIINHSFEIGKFSSPWNGVRR